MTRTLCLAIALLLAGGPQASVLCDAWCGTPAGARHHEAIGCHEGVVLPDASFIVHASPACAASSSVSPYVAEGRMTVKSHSAGTALIPAATVPDGRSGVDVVHARELRLPLLPPSHRVVLRV